MCLILSKLLGTIFTGELLHDNHSSNVALHFNAGHGRPYLVVSCLEEVFCRPCTAPVETAGHWHVIFYVISDCINSSDVVAADVICIYAKQTPWGEIGQLFHECNILVRKSAL